MEKFIIIIPCYTGKLLVSRLEKAQKLQRESIVTLEQLMCSTPVHFSTTDIERWYQLEVASESAHKCVEEAQDVKYFSKLQTYYHVRGDIARASATSLRTFVSRLNMLEAELKSVEEREGFSRWAEDSDTYRDFSRVATEKKKDEVLSDIATCARERWFLLKLKAKFADGQYLASRLSKGITQESSKLKQLIGKYNDLEECDDQRLSWQDVTNLSSPLWLRSVLQGDMQVPKGVKLDAIRNHHMVLRADEEMCLMRKEMRETVCFHLRDWEHLSDARDRLHTTCDSQYTNGATHLLQMALVQCEGRLVELTSAFEKFVDLPELPIDKFLYPFDPLSRHETTSLYANEIDERAFTVESDTSDEESDDASTCDIDTTTPPDSMPYGSKVFSTAVGEFTKLIPPAGPSIRVAPSKPVPPAGPSIRVAPSKPVPPAGPSIRVAPSKPVPPSPSVTERILPSDPSSSEDEDFFPTEDDVKRKCLQLEKEEFLKESRKQQQCELSEHEKTLLTQVYTEQRSQGAKKGFLHRGRGADSLKRSLEASRKAHSKSRMKEAGPYFKPTSRQ